MTNALPGLALNWTPTFSNGRSLKGVFGAGLDTHDLQRGSGASAHEVGVQTSQALSAERAALAA